MVLVLVRGGIRGTRPIRRAGGMRTPPCYMVCRGTPACCMLRTTTGRRSCGSVCVVVILAGSGTLSGILGAEIVGALQMHTGAHIPFTE
jgi:hypothetical protein